MRTIEYEGKQFILVDYINEKHYRKEIPRKLTPKQPCEICGSTDKILRHHETYEDYPKYRWLCRSHHGRLHSKMKKIMRAEERERNVKKC